MSSDWFKAHYPCTESPDICPHSAGGLVDSACDGGPFVELTTGYSSLGKVRAGW